jgi:hypothetical protein
MQPIAKSWANVAAKLEKKRKRVRSEIALLKRVSPCTHSARNIDAPP